MWEGCGVRVQDKECETWTCLKEPLALVRAPFSVVPGAFSELRYRVSLRVVDGLFFVPRYVFDAAITIALS